MNKDLLSCQLCHTDPVVVRKNSPNRPMVACDNIECYFYSNHMTVEKWNSIKWVAPPGYKLVPLIAPVSVQNALKKGMDECCTYQEWWDMIMGAIGDPSDNLINAWIEREGNK